MRDAVFVLSTGRCGTQWIAKVLAEQYSDLLKVAHEPLHGVIDPRQVLGLGSPRDADAPLAEALVGHADAIKVGLQSGGYVECGHVGWSALPHLAELLEGKIRIVHLVRHPVPTAFSWLSHAVYQSPILPHLSERVLLSPFDAGVRFESYRERWDSLTSYEKCLYYWLEVNTLAVEMEACSGVPWLRLRTEDLFGGDGLERLLGFLGLDSRDGIDGLSETREDQFRYLVSSEWVDWRLVERHPEVLGLMEEFGYTTADVDEEGLLRRYFGTGPMAG